MRIKIDYIIDDENWTDEQYENQVEQTVYITGTDIVKILSCGNFEGQCVLMGSQTISEITDIKIEQ